MVVRSEVNNPFVPGSDEVPTVWAGRVASLSDWRDVLRPRRLHGVYERGRAFLGEPGIGKSVLAQRIAGEAASAGDIVVPRVRVPLGADAVAQLARGLAAAVEGTGLAATVGRGAGDFLDRVRALSLPVGGVELAAAAPRDRHEELTSLLVDLGRAARSRDRAVVVCVDEVQNITDKHVLSQLLVAIGDALAHHDTVVDAVGTPHDKVLPLAVYLTGLPEFTDRATSVAGATFARRFAPVLLTHLDDAEVRLALAPFTGAGWPVLTDDGPGRVVMTDAAVEALASCCLGDPFLFQLAGNAAWRARTGAIITDEDVLDGWAGKRAEARRHVEASLQRLPASERAFVDALAALTAVERTLKGVASALGRTSSEVATTARRLEDIRGLIRRGRPYEFTARTVEGYLGGSWP